jgi:hypothetical protein
MHAEGIFCGKKESKKENLLNEYSLYDRIFAQSFQGMILECGFGEISKHY